MSNFLKSKELNINHLLIIISLVIFGVIYMFSSFSLAISLCLSVFIFIFSRLVNEIGKGMPIKELMSFLFLIQVFISPLITYRYLNNKAHFTMHIDESIYMFYTVPAALLFILGLFIPLSKSKNDYKSIFNKLGKNSTKKTDQVAFLFITLGFLSSFLYFILPGSLFFLLYLFNLLKFIGAFMLLFSKNRFKYFWVAIVFINFTYGIINGGIFYDLFIWVFFLYMLLEKKIQSSFTRKLLIITIGFFAIYFVQSIKSDFRSEVWDEKNTKESSEIFLNVAQEKSNEKNVFKNENDLDKFISRLNTGWILSKVIEHTPRKEPFTNGKTLTSDLKSVLLPRFLFPNKAKSGGKENQKKFTKFTGRRLIGKTTMRIGALSDAYINFGIFGGVVFMFFLGLFFNFIFFLIIRISIKNYFYILWIPFVFAYAIRMSDIQVILNYTIKAFFFVVILNYIFLNPPSLKANKIDIP